VLLAIFTLSIFLSAALLFMVQPMAGKSLLPLLGGSPAVWNTCMVFFQGALLAGYGYSHLLTTRLAQRRQALVHCVLLALAAATLPMPVDVGDPGSADPVGWLLATLALTVGLPFFVVSTTGPLLQRWFSTTSHAPPTSGRLKRMLRVRRWVWSPASWIGRMWAGWPDSLWCECHRPGGVTNAEPGRQSTRCGSRIRPSGPRLRPTSV
jgi:hypothetical protein